MRFVLLLFVGAVTAFPQSIGFGLKGGMPFYKWLGNQVLTRFQNTLLGTHLSEFHSGYRLYSTNALRQIPFERNSNDFHFDTEIIIQLVCKKLRIKELLTRLQDDAVSEVIIATDPNLEGEATATYLIRMLTPLGLRVSKLASGLPVGGDLEYADELTLGRAFEGRTAIA